jgi:hypothetical protein
MDEHTPLPQSDPTCRFEEIMAELTSAEPYQQSLDIARQMLSQIGDHVGELPANAPPEGEVVATLSPRAVHMLKFLHAINIKAKEAELQELTTGQREHFPERMAEVLGDFVKALRWFAIRDDLQDWVSRFYLSKVNDDYVAVADGYDGGDDLA